MKTGPINRNVKGFTPLKMLISTAGLFALGAFIQVAYASTLDICNYVCQIAACPHGGRLWEESGVDSCVTGSIFMDCGGSCTRCAGNAQNQSICLDSEEQMCRIHINTEPNTPNYVPCGAATDYSCTGVYPECQCPGLGSPGGVPAGTCQVAGGCA